MLASSLSLNWLLRVLEFLGVDRSKLPPDDSLQLEWANMPQSLGALGLVALIVAVGYGVIWVYRREIDTCSPRAKFFLACVRIAVLLVLVLIFLGPEMVRLDEKKVKRTILVGRDKSQSFALADSYRDDDQAKVTAAALRLSTQQLRDKKPTRAAVMEELLARDDFKFLRDLDERGKLVIQDFDESMAQPIDPVVAVKDEETAAATNSDEESTQRKFQLPPVAPDGRGTDLWLMIHESLAARSPGAMILFTDGQHTGQGNVLEAAEEAKRQNVRIYIVGIGDPSRPKNLRVDSVYVQPNLFKNDEFGVAVEFSAQDILGEEVTLTLIEQKVNASDGSLGTEKEVASQTVRLTRSKEEATLKHAQKEAGKYVYSVRITPLDDESNLDDNRASAAPTVVMEKERTKVLLVAGAPTWEYRLVQKLLTRDESIQVSCWLQTLDEERAQDGDRPPITRLPLTLQELNEYGVIMLLDPNPIEFDAEWIDALRKYVREQSGGVLFMAGPKYTAQLLSHQRTKDIRDVIPVEFGDVAAVELMTMLSPANKAYPLRVVPVNSDQDILMFYEDRQASQQRWESLPGIFWSFPSLRAKPTASVLLEHSDVSLRTSDGARPLLVTGRYGAGNTAYIGFNGTWRWRQIGREAEFFDKFWVKVVRYLADSRSSKGRRYGSLKTDKDRYEVGDKINITARLQNASYDDLVADQIEATLRNEDGAPIPIILKPVSGRTGTFEGQATARRTGVHTLSVDIPESEGVKPSVDDKNFTVELPRVELNQQWLNRELLEQVANISGGQYIELDQLDELAKAIPDQTETIIERGQSTSLWDLPAVFSLRMALLFLLVALLSVEWALRKSFKLL